MAQKYYYGGFAIHDGVNYFITQKDLSLPEFTQTVFQVARFEGVKKTGERINEKHIPVTVKIIGSSRADLESKIDALYQALALRQQHLTLHTEDARYFIADAVSAKAQLVAGRVVSCDVAITFVAQEPFAYAASAMSYDSLGQVCTLVSGQTWQLPTGFNPVTISGGGNTFARPVITITNKSATNAATVNAALASGTAYTSITITALPSAANTGAVFLLSNGVTTQRVTLSANALAGATTLTVTSFTAAANFAIGNFIGLDIYLLGFQLSQNPDGQVLTVSGVQNTSVGNGGSFVVNCDPITSANGYTIILSSNNALQAFTGSFPVMEPGTTQFTLQVTCYNQPTVEFQVDWTPRWYA